jgi:cyclic pyranopterin phosphate synthase
MVDVGAKGVTERECVARGAVRMQPSTLARIASGNAAKGDVLAIARIAAIQAAKRTAEWVPLAHPVPLDAVEVELVPDTGASAVRIEAVRGRMRAPVSRWRRWLRSPPPGSRSTTCARRSIGR